MGVSTRKPAPTAWTFRPVSRLARVGDQRKASGGVLVEAVAREAVQLQRRPVKPNATSGGKALWSRSITTTFGVPLGACADDRDCPYTPWTVAIVSIGCLVRRRGLCFPI
jgi:hypothetical protein